MEQFARLCDVVFVITHIQTALQDCYSREATRLSDYLLVQFLADSTNGRAYATVRPSSVVYL